MATLKKRAARPVRVNVIRLEDTTAYARGMDAPSEMEAARSGWHELSEHIDCVITYAKDAHVAASLDLEDSDEDAIKSLQVVTTRAFKAIAMLRRRRGLGVKS